MTIASAIPAAVVSMAVLRALGGGGILENNIVQTGASAGTVDRLGRHLHGAGAGASWATGPTSEYWWVLAIAGLGGLLGVLFSVPLRRSLIVDQQMAFPEGKAAAEVLRAGENPGEASRSWASRRWSAASAKLIAASGLRLIPDSALGQRLHRQVPELHGHRTSRRRCSASATSSGSTSASSSCPAASCRSTSRSRSTTRIFLAAIRSSRPTVAAPARTSQRRMRRSDRADAAQRADPLSRRRRDAGRRPVGAVHACASRCVSGVKSGLAAARAGSDTVVAHTDRDLPMKWVLVGIVLFTHSAGRAVPAASSAVVGVGIADVGHHGRRRLPVLLGVGVHGGPGRFVQQPGVRHHDRDDPVRCAGVARLPRQATRRSARSRRS